MPTVPSRREPTALDKMRELTRRLVAVPKREIPKKRKPPKGKPRKR